MSTETTEEPVIPDGSLVVSFDRQPGDETMLGRDRFILRTHALVEATLAAGAVPQGAAEEPSSA